MGPMQFVVMSVNAARHLFSIHQDVDAIRRLKGGLTVNPQTRKYVANEKVFNALIEVARSNVDVETVITAFLFPEESDSETEAAKVA